MNKKLRDFLILGAGRAVTAVTSILYIRVATTLLSPSEMGRMNIILTVSGWFGLVLLNPVGMYMSRRLIEWREEGRLSKHLKAWMGYVGAVAFFSVLLVPVYRPLLGIDIGFLWLLALVMAGVIFTTGNASFAGFLNLLGHRFSFVAGSVLTLWFGLGFSALLVTRWTPSAELWLAGQLAGQALAFALILYLLARLLPARQAGAEAAPLDGAAAVWKFSWPLSISVFLYWIHTQGYRFLFQHMAGAEALGIFVVGFAIGSSLMLIFENLFNQFYGPIYYAEISNSSEEAKTLAWNKYAKVFIPMVVLTVAFVSMNGAALAKIIASSKFKQGGEIVVWGAAAEGLRMVVSLFSLVSVSKLKMSPIILPGLAGILVLLGGMLLLVPLDQFNGTGAAIVLGWLAAGTYIYFNMKKLLPIQIPWRQMLPAAALTLPIVAVRLLNSRFGNENSLLVSAAVLALSGTLLAAGYAVILRNWLPGEYKAQLLEKLARKRKVFVENILEMVPFR